MQDGRIQIGAVAQLGERMNGIPVPALFLNINNQTGCSQRGFIEV